MNLYLAYFLPVQWIQGRPTLNRLQLAQYAQIYLRRQRWAAFLCLGVALSCTPWLPGKLSATFFCLFGELAVAFFLAVMQTSAVAAKAKAKV